jgi:mono/diheme cytochrome c family protein
MRVFLILTTVTLMALGGCDSGDLTLDQADPDAVPAEPTFDQVFSIFQRECAPCHTDDDDDGEDTAEQDSPGRSPGGVGPNYSTCASIIQNLDSALGSIFGNNDMPPGSWPRLTSEEKLIIQRWVEQWEAQGEVSPCN